MSCERTEITRPLVADSSASAVCGSSTSAMILVFGFAFSDLTERTVETITASPLSSESRMMIDFAPATFARARSAGLLTSPVRVITLSLPRFSARVAISESIFSRATSEKITTFGLRWFSPAIASSLRIGNTRFDHPRIRVWSDSITALLPAFRRATARVMAAEMKPITAPLIATPMPQ